MTESDPASDLEDRRTHEVFVREKIERGLRDIEDGRLVSHEEVKRRLITSGSGSP